nr:MAG TPA: hypothetical protein [Caudoviricetes sp.]
MKKCWMRRVVALLAVLYVDPYVRKVRIKKSYRKEALKHLTTRLRDE